MHLAATVISCCKKCSKEYVSKLTGARNKEHHIKKKYISWKLYVSLVTDRKNIIYFCFLEMVAKILHIFWRFKLELKLQHPNNYLPVFVYKIIEETKIFFGIIFLLILSVELCNWYTFNSDTMQPGRNQLLKVFLGLQRFFWTPIKNIQISTTTWETS